MSFPIAGVGSGGVLPDLVKRLRDTASKLSGVPAIKEAVDSLKQAIDSLEMAINDQDSAGSQRLKESMVAMFMHVSKLIPNWQHHLPDHERQNMGIKQMDSGMNQDAIRNMVHQIVNPSQPHQGTPTMPPPKGETPPPSNQPTLTAISSHTKWEDIASNSSSNHHRQSLDYAQAQQLIRHLARLNIPVPITFLGDMGSFNINKLDQLKDMVKHIERARRESLGQREADLLERICDQLIDGIDHIAELEGILKMVSQVSHIPDSVMDLLKDMVQSWFVNESQDMSPQESTNLIKQVNQMAISHLGGALLSESPDSIPNQPSKDTPPIQPVALSYLPSLTRPLGEHQPPKLTDQGFQQVGVCLDYMVELVTHHALHQVDADLDRIQRFLGG